MPVVKYLVIRLLSAALLVTALQAQIGYGVVVPVVNIDPSIVPSQQNGFNESHGDGMVGWLFTITQNTTITKVGWYDDGGDGLARAYQVGLWKDTTGQGTWNGGFAAGSNPTQLLGIPALGLSIPAGTNTELVGSDWRVVTLNTPLVLTPGSYELAGLDTVASTDVIKYVASYPTRPTNNIPGDFGETFFWAYGPTNHANFGFVDNQSFYLAGGLELGPMLFVDVPEPSSLGLLVVGAGLLIRKRVSGAKK